MISLPPIGATVLVRWTDRAGETQVHYYRGISESEAEQGCAEDHGREGSGFKAVEIRDGKALKLAQLYLTAMDRARSATPAKRRENAAYLLGVEHCAEIMGGNLREAFELLIQSTWPALESRSATR